MRRLLVLACAVVFLESIFFSILTPLLPDFKAAHHLGEGGAGVLVGSYAAGALFFALPAGLLAARVSPRATVVTGLVGIGVASTVFGFAGNLILLDSARFLQGGFGALMWAGGISWVISAADRSHRGRLLGTVLSAALVGELLGAPFGALAHVIGTGPVFSAIVIISVALILLALTIPDAAEEAGQRAGEAVRRARGSLLPRAILMLAIPVTAYGVLIVAAPLRIADHGGSAVVIAAAFACGALIEAVLGPVVGRVSDRIGRTGPYFAGTLVMGGGLVAVGALDRIPLLAAAVVTIAFGAGLAFTPASALITEAATAAGVNQGYANGGANAAFGGGNMLGSIGGGAIAGATGFLLPCLVMALLLALSGLAARRLTEPVLEATGEHPLPAPAGDG